MNYPLAILQYLQEACGTALKSTGQAMLSFGDKVSLEATLQVDTNTETPVGVTCENTFDQDFTPLFYYKMLRAEVEREDGITHQRLTWLMTFEGFLLAAMTFLLSSAWPSGNEHRGIVVLRQMTIGAVGITGFILAAVSATGIKASRDALDHVINDWNRINRRLKIVPEKAPRTFGEGSAYTLGESVRHDDPGSLHDTMGIIPGRIRMRDDVVVVLPSLSCC